MKAFCLSLLLLLVASEAALADGELASKITAEDRARLDRFDAVRSEALAEAKAGGSPGDVAVLETVLNGDALSPHGGFNATGAWRCRTIKLGGLLPLTIYPWFKCRISDDGSGWRLEKLSGSQRTSGWLYDDGDTRLIYLGAGHYGDEKPRAYNADASRNEVAYVTRPSKNRLLFAFPAPKYESKLDLLELRR